MEPKVLSNRFRGISLEEAMNSAGADPSIVRAKARTISQEELDGVRAHIELHIEQGNFLEVAGIDLGIVTSIRGAYRCKVLLKGEFDHAGATPMGADYRRDANLALAHILVAIDGSSKQVLPQGKDLVQTAGVINSNQDFNNNDPRVYQNAGPKVSGFSYFFLDVRSTNNSFLTEYSADLERLIYKVAADFRVDSEIQVIGVSEALEATDTAIQNILESASRQLQISSVRMPSGAMHDTGIIGTERQSNGNRVPVGMLFIPCKGGKSHCPEEYATFAAIAKGASVLATGMCELLR